MGRHMHSRGRGTAAGTHNLPPCPIIHFKTYLSFGRSDVIHGTILAFAQWPTWPTLGGCLRLGGIAQHGAPILSWRRSATALRHG